MTDTVAMPQGMEAFTFGDPTPVLDTRGILDYLECWQNGRWYEPPVSLDGLSKTARANVYLQSGLRFKVNMLVRTFRPSRLLNTEGFEQFATDWVHFGMAYLERRNSMLGNAVQLVPQGTGPPGEGGSPIPAGCCTAAPAGSPRTHHQR